MKIARSGKHPGTERKIGVEKAIGDPTCNRRNKMGLALAGGGFRASLFHLGVLRRMAELDLLRYVEVLSTVSGGSIIGALYALLLKKYLDDPESNGRLRRDEYLRLLDELQDTLTRGIGKNLRTRLFMNPLGFLRVLVTTRTLGKQMARLYERHLYGRVVAEIQQRGRWDRWFRPGRIKLKDIRIKPGGKEISVGIEAYNRDMVAGTLTGQDSGSALTRLILNATSLNSGARFWFSSTEIGDWFLGHFRWDEIPILLDRKRLLEDASPERLETGLAHGMSTLVIEGREFDRRTVAFALWWRASPSCGAGPAGWDDLFRVAGFPGRLPGGEFGRLRLAKLAAWYLRHPEVKGGFSKTWFEERFWSNLEDIDEELTERLKEAATNHPPVYDLLLDFVLELYYFRSAEIASPGIARDWDALSLGEAVGASACFPPVFPPMQFYGLYDDWHVSRLGLTDGGVFDNIGLTALLEEECDCIIVSDTSGVFGVQERASTGRLEMMARITGILMANVAWTQRDILRERRRVSRQISTYLETQTSPDPGWLGFHAGRELHDLAFFHISSPRVQPPPPAGPGWDMFLDALAVARIRTDLDGFGQVEIAALVNHGYATADRFIRRYLQDSPYHNAHWDSPPAMPIPVTYDDRVRRIVDVGALRFGRALKLGAWASWGFTAVLAVVAGAVVVSENGRRFVPDVLRWLMNLGVGFVTTTAPLLVAVGALLAVIGLAWVCTQVSGFNLVKWLYARQWSGWGRLAGGVAKWGRGLSGNVFWCFFGAPVWIALGFAIFAALSHLFFYLPFRRITRIDRGR